MESYYSITIFADKKILNPINDRNCISNLTITAKNTKGEAVVLNNRDVKFSIQTIYTTNSQKVIEVSQDGVVTPLNGGLAKITAEIISLGEGKTASINIVVRPFYHEYHKSITAKFFCGIEPFGTIENEKSASYQWNDVMMTFSEALENIKKLDRITCGIPKIVYLVGWQEGGHDHSYPDFTKVNPKLADIPAASPAESLNILMREARKFNTCVSLHLNLNDAYESSSLHEKYIKDGLYQLDNNGNPTFGSIGSPELGFTKVFRVLQSKLWESGEFVRKMNELIEILPEIKHSHTIHFDNWVANNSEEFRGVTQGDEENAMVEMFKYMRSIGFDVTSEGAFHGRRQPMVGYQPLAWWDAPYSPINCPPCLYSASRKGRQDPDPRLGDNCQLENILMTNWRKKVGAMTNVMSEFCMTTLLYSYLSTLEIISYDDQKVEYSNGVTAKISNGICMIWKGGWRIRESNTVFVPLTWKKSRQAIMYAQRDTAITTKMPEGWEDVEEIDVYLLDDFGENEPLLLYENVKLNDGTYHTCPDYRCAYLIKPSKDTN